MAYNNLTRQLVTNKDIDFESLNEAEKKDEILKFLNYVGENGQPDYRDGFYFHNTVNAILNNSKMHSKEVTFLLKSLEYDNFIEYNDNTFGYKFESTQFLKEGGYIEHEKYKNTILEEEQKIEQLTNDKLISDTKFSKWQVKTFWLFFGFSILSLIVNIYLAFNQC